MGDAEVADLHRAVGEQEDVRRLDVAVDHALLVRVVERVQDLRHDAHDVGDAEALVRLEARLQLASLDELHRDVPDACFLAEIVDRHDVRVVEAARRVRLAAKAVDHLDRVLAGELVLADRLQRDDALDHRIVGFVDDAHRAAADLAPDLVLADVVDVWHASLPARKQRRRRRRRPDLSPSAGYLYFASISQTDFCTSRCTIVSSDTPPCCALLTPSAPDDTAPISIFSSV